MRYWLPALLCLLSPLGDLSAQTPSETPASAWPASAWVKRTWQTENGLPDNSVTGVVQSGDGYLWVATLGGLIRFNGEKFEDFPLINIPGVANRVVRAMFHDRQDRLWLAMDRGSVLCVGATAARVYDQKDGLENTRILSIAQDGAGEIWLLAHNALYQVAGENVTRFGTEEGLPTGAHPCICSSADGDIWYARGVEAGRIHRGRWQSLLRFNDYPVLLCAANDGGVWICADDKVMKYAGQGQPQQFAALPRHCTVTMMFESRSGGLWVGTASDGLFRLRGNALEPVEGLHDEVLCAAEDREGNLWIGTAGGGLSRLRPQAIHLSGISAGLPGESIASICRDGPGSVWMALNDGQLARARNGQWSLVTEGDGWPGGKASCVAAAVDGGVWIGTGEAGLAYFKGGKFQQWGPEEGLGSLSVRALLAARNGDLWLTTHQPDRLVCFHQGKFQSYAPPGDVRVIRTLAEGMDGTIWAGTSGGQVLRVSGSTLLEDPTANRSHPMSVRALHVTADGSLWIGYAGWGVARVWEGHYARVTSTNGLYDDYVSQIQSDNQGGLWFTSNHGLFQVRAGELEAFTEGQVPRVRSIVYGPNEGLGSLQPVFDAYPNSFRDSDGALWFATRNGLLQIQPAQIQDDTNPPPVVLERVTVDDQTAALWDSGSPLRSGAGTNAVSLRGGNAGLALAPGHRKIEFEFAALSYVSPENVHFRYRLKNFDADWNETSLRQPVKYPRLPSGQYEFQVQACDSAGVWNEAGFRLPIEVRPFIWQRWWFQSGLLLLFTALIFGVARYFSFQRLRRQLAQLEQQAGLQRERARIARDMHDEVGSKLSRLSFLTEMAAQHPQMPEAARADASEISETARDTIRSFEEIVWAVNPKNDSLAQLVNYLCRFAEEFFDGSPVQCVFDLPEVIPDIALPTGARHHVFLAAKEALNNIFKHAQAGRVCLRLTLEDGAFEIAIEDDGRGLGAAAAGVRRAGSGNGLENMRERMHQAGGEFAIGNRQGGGTIVTLRLRTVAQAKA